MTEIHGQGVQRMSLSPAGDEAEVLGVRFRSGMTVAELADAVAELSNRVAAIECAFYNAADAAEAELVKAGAGSWKRAVRNRIEELREQVVGKLRDLVEGWLEVGGVAELLEEWGYLQPEEVGA